MTSTTAPPALAFLHAYGIHVTPTTDIDTGDVCVWCCKNPLAVRVYGDPHPRESVLFPLELEDCCVSCGPWLVSRALSEQTATPSGPVKVEVTGDVWNARDDAV